MICSAGRYWIEHNWPAWRKRQWKVAFRVLLQNNPNDNRSHAKVSGCDYVLIDQYSLSLSLFKSSPMNSVRVAAHIDWDASDNSSTCHFWTSLRRRRWWKSLYLVCWWPTGGEGAAPDRCKSWSSIWMWEREKRQRMNSICTDFTAGERNYSGYVSRCRLIVSPFPLVLPFLSFVSIERRERAYEFSSVCFSFVSIENWLRASIQDTTTMPATLLVPISNKSKFFSYQHNTHGSVLKYVDVIHRPEGESAFCVNKKILWRACPIGERERESSGRKILNVIAQQGKAVKEQRIHTRAIEICCKAWRHARERMRCAEGEVNRTRARREWAREREHLFVAFFSSLSRLAGNFERIHNQRERERG